jgi:hypothetical protein
VHRVRRARRIERAARAGRELVPSGHSASPLALGRYSIRSRTVKRNA